MTLFEQKFIVLFLDKLRVILSDQDELELAIKAFGRESAVEHPFYLRYKIPNAIYWSCQELLQFNAAYSQALSEILSAHGHKPSHLAETPESLINAVTLLQTEYLPKITTELGTRHRLHSIIEKIDTCLEASINIEQPIASAKTASNSYRFFLGTCMAAAVIGTTLYLGQKR